MKDTNHFSFYDATINVTTEQADDWDSYNTVRAVMRQSGFTFHQDPAIKKRWPSLAKTHFAGRKRDVHFVSDIYGRGFKVDFYEDVIRDNKCGGLYHFHKMEKMPYLRRLSVQKALITVATVLRDRGFQDETRPDPVDAVERLWARRKEMENQGHDFYRKPIPDYNSKDADGRFLKDGDIRYFRSWTGHLMRGTVYHNINNMWWVLVNHSCLLNNASFDLFSCDPRTLKRKVPPNPLQSMRTKLAEYVERQDFERAIGLRDAIKRLVDQSADAPEKG